MRIDAIELRELPMRLRFRFQTSFGVEQDRRIMLVTVRSGDVEGVAECVAGEFPGYSYETTDSCWSVIRDHVAPHLVGKSFETADELLHSVRSVRGNNMAVAAVEMAFWDAKARALNVPLWQLLGGIKRPIPVGISIGIQESPRATADAARRAVDEGYRRVKLKIQPGWDVKVVAAVREALPDVPLTVDANSAYRLTDARVMRELDAFGLDYVERQLATPICLDESIHSPEDARKGLQWGSGRIVNLKVGRVRGFREARRVHDVAVAFGAPVWCGGMLETGIGRAANLHLSLLEGFTLPGDTSSASRYWDQDLIHEPLEAVDGVQTVPEHAPGIGVTLNRAFVDERTVRLETIQP
jgi:O-succinylbenzoate synthase